MSAGTCKTDPPLYPGGTGLGRLPMPTDSCPWKRPDIRNDHSPSEGPGAPKDRAPPGAGVTGGASGSRPRPGALGEPGMLSVGCDGGGVVGGGWGAELSTPGTGICP